MFSYFINVVLRGKRCPYCGHGFTQEEWNNRDKETGGHNPCTREPVNQPPAA